MIKNFLVAKQLCNLLSKWKSTLYQSLTFCLLLKESFINNSAAIVKAQSLLLDNL